MIELLPRQTTGAAVEDLGNGVWRLQVPAGPAGRYRWAQLDDYMHRKRSEFLWNRPLTFSVKARVSSQAIPGTWGFGLWNDPFNASLGVGGTARRTPLLPETVWFFYASPPNYLAFQDNHPAQGMLAATFSSSHIPSLALALGLPFIPLLAWPYSARLLRRLARSFIHEDAHLLDMSLIDWHAYQFEWLLDRVRFLVDGQFCCETQVVPSSWMGLVLWIDNQYAAFTPQGKVSFGTLANPEPAWLELMDINIESY
jgi:hypothetical protein